jgi:ABC-2 type transport system permease protein
MTEAVTSNNAWPAVLTLAQRELVRFFRQKNRVFGALGQPIIFWLLFSEGLRGNKLDYAHFFPGTLVMILLFTAIFATISIIEDRNEGFLQSVLVSPAPRWAMVLGKVLGGAAIAMIQGLIFLALGAVTLPWPSRR